MKNRIWGLLLLGIFLIIYGVVTFAPSTLASLHPQEVMAGLAIAAGALLVVNR